jgi:sulfite reductase (NADPH) flavoprotein alpha-component
MPGLRVILFRLHWALGLTAGMILAVVGATGALLSYEDALTGWANRDRGTVVARATPRLTPGLLSTRIEEQTGGHRVARLTLADDASASVAVRFARDPATRERPVSVYADPYDGTILGPVRGEVVFATILGLHRWLLLPGEGRGWGRQITGFCALALLVFLGSGLVLRWPKVHRARIWLRPSLSRPGRPRWWSLHAVAGTWLLPVYAIIALSGLTWSYDWFKDGAHRLLVGPPSTEASAKRMGGKAPADKASPPAIDAAWNAFRAGEGREAGLSQLLVPEEGRQPIRIRWFAKADPRPSMRNEARYDAAGTLLASERAADQPLGKRIAGNMLEVHRGRFFGEVFALVFCLAALAMPGFAATGLTLYVLRRRAAGRRVAKRPLVPAAAE